MSAHHEEFVKQAWVRLMSGKSSVSLQDIFSFGKLMLKAGAGEDIQFPQVSGIAAGLDAAVAIPGFLAIEMPASKPQCELCAFETEYSQHCSSARCSAEFRPDGKNVYFIKALK